MKIKKPLTTEYNFFHKNLILYTYLHLTTEPELTKQLTTKNPTPHTTHHTPQHVKHIERLNTIKNMAEHYTPYTSVSLNSSPPVEPPYS
jgi:Alanine dehydrogenase